MSPVQHRTAFTEHAPEWLGAVARRRSRRAYDSKPVPAAMLSAIDELCTGWRPYPDARTVLIEHPMVDIFTGIIGGYGKVRDAPHVLVFIGDERAEFADQHVGYTGEAIILEAARQGLSSCWVGGFFSAKKVGRLVELGTGERVYAVSPLGFARSESTSTERAMEGMAGAHQRKPVEQLAPGIAQGGWPEWAVAAVETARLAPSAVNRQPWRFRLDEGSLVIAKDSPFETPKVTKRLDIGIAMLHAELAADAYGVTGTWSDLDGNDVARFDPEA